MGGWANKMSPSLETRAHSHSRVVGAPKPGSWYETRTVITVNCIGGEKEKLEELFLHVLKQWNNSFDNEEKIRAEKSPFGNFPE